MYNQENITVFCRSWWWSVFLLAVKPHGPLSMQEWTQRRSITSWAQMPSWRKWRYDQHRSAGLNVFMHFNLTDFWTVVYIAKKKKSMVLFYGFRWWDCVASETTPDAGTSWFSRPLSVWTDWSRLPPAKNGTTSWIRYCKHLPMIPSEGITVNKLWCSSSNLLFIYLSG